MATNQEKLDRTHYLTDRYLDMPISAVADRVLQAKVKRGGKQITLIQEIADAKTVGLENKAAIAALTALVGQLATGQDIDYERIKQDTADVIKAGVTVTVEVPTTKDQP